MLPKKSKVNTKTSIRKKLFHLQGILSMHSLQSAWSAFCPDHKEWKHLASSSRITLKFVQMIIMMMMMMMMMMMAYVMIR